MASEWLLSRLGDVVEHTKGFAFKSGDYRPSGWPIVRASDFRDWDVSMEQSLYLDDELAPQYLRYLLREGDILIATVGSKPGSGSASVGRVVRVGKRASGALLNQNTVRLRPNASVECSFLFYLLKNIQFRDFILGTTGGSAQSSITLDNIFRFQFQMPPMATQTAIGELLDGVSRRIESLEDANKTLEQIASAIFKSWFVDFDPVRAKAEGREPEGMDAATANLFPGELVGSSKGELPLGWSIQRLSDFVEVNPSRVLSKVVPAPYLEMANAPTSGPRPAGWVDRLPISGCRFRNGDTLLAKITPCLENGKTAFVDFLNEGQTGWGSTEFIVLAPKPPIPASFGYLLARYEAFRVYAIQSMSGTSGRQRVQVDQLAKFEFPVADARVYGAFGEIVQPMFASIKQNDETAKTLAELRDTLLPRLISGKLRVPEAEKLVEAVL